jgi:hypothetical protein
MDLIWFWCVPIVTAACIAYGCTAFHVLALVKGLLLRSNQRNVELVTNELANATRRDEDTFVSELNQLKELYFKLHNLENFYDDILPRVGSTLGVMISEALEDEMVRAGRGILDIETYSRQSLEEFLHSEYDTCMQRWEKYNLRRQAGGCRELFMNREDASDSIRRLAPLKLVDGAWLSHVNKISTSAALRQATQNAWQILSEELGDGDLRKNHVHVYTELIRETGWACPEPHSLFFIDPLHNMTDIHVWKAAVAQQLISLLPEMFMPEILGFNLHFESVAFETLVASRELKEVGYNPSYSLLHVSIDNPHSGHSAIALEIVVEYLDHVGREPDSEGLQVAWNRVRAGYVLSKFLTEATNQLPSPQPTEFSRREEAVIKIIASKAQAAQKIHCGSRTRIGDYHISRWLDKERIRQRTWQNQFLKALSNTGSLVLKGRSADSRLVKEISWGGKMYGSFTNLEVRVIKQWIDSLPQKTSSSYWNFAGLPPDKVTHKPRTDNQCWTNAFYHKTPLIDQALCDCNNATFPFTTSPNNLRLTEFPDLNKILPLWFAGLGLLQNFVTVPSKVANRRTCAILRVLRAQNGFTDETEGIGGLDEALRSDRVNLIDIGMDWMDKAGLKKPQRVDIMIQTSDAVFLREFSALSVRPEQHSEVLVGLSCAFVELHQAMVPFASPSFRDALQHIATRERCGLEEWLADLQEVIPKRSKLCQAYSVGMQEIATCFNLR